MWFWGERLWTECEMLKSSKMNFLQNVFNTSILWNDTSSTICHEIYLTGQPIYLTQKYKKSLKFQWLVIYSFH